MANKLHLAIVNREGKLKAMYMHEDEVSQHILRQAIFVITENFDSVNPHILQEARDRIGHIAARYTLEPVENFEHLSSATVLI